MDPQMLQQLLGGAGGPPIPSGQDGPVPQDIPSQDSQQSPPWMPLLEQALDKMASMGIPFAGDIVHLMLKGGGSPQTWNTLIKTIDSYGKHKQSVHGLGIQGGPAGGNHQTPSGPPPAPPQPMVPGSPQPPGVYS